jgi:hypothetical protein
MNKVNLDIEFDAYYNERKEKFDEGGLYPFLEYLKGKKLENVTVRIDTDFYPFEETDIFCEKLYVKELSYEKKDHYFIAHVVTDAKAAKPLIKVICELGFHGNPGHSFEFKIDKERFGFDGDGADRVIKINGKKVFNNKLPQLYTDILNAGYDKKEVVNDDKLQEIISEAIKKVMNY